MALLTRLSLADARAIGQRYELNIHQIQPLSAGSVNSNFRLQTRDGSTYFLRIYEEQQPAGAQAELRLVRALHAGGILTPPPVALKSGGDVDQHDSKPVGIYEWIEGEILCQKAVTPAAARALGKALAEVHCCTQWLSEVPAGRFGVSDLLARLGAIDRRTDVYRSDTKLIRDRLEFHVARMGDCPQGLIHGDLFRDNVLWVPGVYEPDSRPELAALIDFESASQGVFVYDIMVCIHSWCFSTQYDLDLVSALLQGYQSIRRLSAAEWAALPHHGALAALRFAATRITDFAMRTAPGTVPGRDYQRFLIRLQALEAGVLDSVMKEGSK